MITVEPGEELQAEFSGRLKHPEIFREGYAPLERRKQTLSKSMVIAGMRSPIAGRHVQKIEQTAQALASHGPAVVGVDLDGARSRKILVLSIFYQGYALSSVFSPPP